jgi:hypothetical protein
MIQKLSSILIVVFFLTGCVQPDSDGRNDDLAPDIYSTADQVDFLIYRGPGSWKYEIESIKKILFSHGASYMVKSQADFNNMSLEDFRKFKVIMFAGGDAPTVRRVLNPETRAHIRKAVQDFGLNYLGFCAGAWLAVAPAPAPGEDTVYGIGVINGPIQNQTPFFQRGMHFTLDEAIFPNGTRRKLLWYGGPVTPNLPNSVVAKYSDGQPAISQIRSGQGLVIISGLHPAATKGILDSLAIYDAEAIDPDFAWEMMNALIERRPLLTFSE